MVRRFALVAAIIASCWACETSNTEEVPSSSDASDNPVAAAWDNMQSMGYSFVAATEHTSGEEARQWTLEFEPPSDYHVSIAVPLGEGCQGDGCVEIQSVEWVNADRQSVIRGCDQTFERCDPWEANTTTIDQAEVGPWPLYNLDAISEATRYADAEFVSDETVDGVGANRYRIYVNPFRLAAQERGDEFPVDEMSVYECSGEWHSGLEEQPTDHCTVRVEPTDSSGEAAYDSHPVPIDFWVSEDNTILRISSLMPEHSFRGGDGQQQIEFTFDSFGEVDIKPPTG